MSFGLQAGIEPIAGYRLVRPLGRGGSGEVWEAAAPGEVPVALKFIPLDAPLAEPELRALEVIRQIRHPHLLDVQFVVFLEGHLIVAMPLCDESLADRLDDCRSAGLEALPLPELLGYMGELAPAIDYLNEPRHTAPDGSRVGIQHRDIKPHNIFRVGDSVRLADFGLAKVIASATAEHSTGLSPYYAPPELLRGQVSRWTDQYSFAACYFHLRMGRRLFSGPIAEVMSAHLRSEPDLDGLPDRERGAVARALSKRPEDRWPDCRAFVRALNEATAARQTRADAPPPPHHPHYLESRTLPRWAGAWPEAGRTDPSSEGRATVVGFGVSNAVHGEVATGNPPEPAASRSDPVVEGSSSPVADGPVQPRRVPPRWRIVAALGCSVVVATSLGRGYRALPPGVVAPRPTATATHPIATSPPTPRPEEGARVPVAVRPPVAIPPGARVAELFEARCVACHRADLACGGVAVFDRESLVRNGTIIISGPSRSPLLTRVAGGSDPLPSAGHPSYAPGEEAIVREWIKGGAPPFTQPARVARPDQSRAYDWGEYALRAILDDVRKLSPRARGAARYLSLDHRVASGDDPQALRRHRDAILRAVADLSGSRRLVEPVPIDPASIVYRVDLEALGWDAPPYQPAATSGAQAALRDLFDLVLLEYPYGVIPARALTFERLTEEWLGPTGPARPIPSVRADWFLSAVSRPPLRDEIRRRTGAIHPADPGDGFGAPLSMEQAERELPRGQHGAELTAFRPGVPGLDPILRRFQAGPVSRDAWEEAFPSVVRTLGVGTPIEPIDALSAGAFEARGESPDLRVTTNRPDNLFVAGDGLVITVSNRSGRPIYIEMFGRGTRGEIQGLTPRIAKVEAGGRYRFPASGEIAIAGTPGVEQILVYHASRPFMPAGILKGDGPPDRILHPFPISRPPEGTKPDVPSEAPLFRSSIEITTRATKKGS